MGATEKPAGTGEHAGEPGTGDLGGTRDEGPRGSPRWAGWHGRALEVGARCSQGRIRRSRAGEWWQGGGNHADRPQALRRLRNVGAGVWGGTIGVARFIRPAQCPTRPFAHLLLY